VLFEPVLMPRLESSGGRGKRGDSTA
jgi:hypothetical protein